ncbi:MAG: tetratricopeptide repeat protein [Fulvivirga sp.]|uniref:tetratricopeptide repeat-containing sensor histidine kinase n=1 Tax=Fulvivirga sp. TaxID=1931237 RepID=UPI0032EC4E2E
MRLLVLLFALTQAIGLDKEAAQNRQKGIEFKNSGQPDSALFYLEAAQNQFTLLKDSIGLANVKVNIASVENSKGNYVRSYRLYQEALSIFKGLNDIQGVIKVYVNLGNQELRLNNLEEALSNYLEAEKYSLDSDSHDYLAYIYNGLGSILIEKDFIGRNIEEAEKYFNRGLELFKESNNTGQASFIYNNLAIIYKEKGEYKKAIESYENFIDNAVKIDNQSYLLKGYHNLSILYKAIGKYNLSLENLKKAEEIAISISDPINYIHILSNLVDVNMSLGNFHEAQFYLEKYKSLRDSIYDDDKIESLTELQVKYQTKEKEDLLAKEIELSNERKWRNIFLTILSLVLIAGLCVIIWLNKKRRMEERNTLERQKEIETLKASIEGENKERKRLATDLHDSVGGILTAVRMIHSSYKNQVGESAEKVDRLLSEAAETVREVSHNISPATLDRYGLKKSIEHMFESLPDTIEVNHSINLPEGGVDKDVERAIDYIVKELTNNTIKHAQAESIDLQINVLDNALMLTYEDDGMGVELKMNSHGLGLQSIINRVELLGGTVQLNSSLGHGFICSIEIAI